MTYWSVATSERLRQWKSTNFIQYSGMSWCLIQLSFNSRTRNKFVKQLFFEKWSSNTFMQQIFTIVNSNPLARILEPFFQVKWKANYRKELNFSIAVTSDAITQFYSLSQYFNTQRKSSWCFWRCCEDDLILCEKIDIGSTVDQFHGIGSRTETRSSFYSKR